MRYRHKPSGAEIEIASALSAPDWEEVCAEPPRPKQETPKKSAKKAVAPGDKRIRND